MLKFWILVTHRVYPDSMVYLNPEKYLYKDIGKWILNTFFKKKFKLQNDLNFKMNHSPQYHIGKRRLFKYLKWGLAHGNCPTVIIVIIRWYWFGVKRKSK